MMFVLILAAGFIAGKCKVLTKPAQSGLTNLILYVTLPCAIVDSFRVAYSPSMLISMGITVLIAVFVQAFSQLLSVVLYRKQPPARRSIFRYGTIVCNSTFFGLAVIASLFGGVSLSYGAVYLIPQRIAMWTLGVAVFTKDKQRHALAKTLIHPAMIAVYIGLVFLLFPIDLPQIVAGPLVVLGDCTMPLSMLIVGSILSETKLSMMRDKHIFGYSFIRLIVIPGVTFLVCMVFHVSREVMQVCVLIAGMPAGTMTSLLALRYDGDEKLASTIIVISLILFFILLPGWLFLFGKY
jgi:predicted permease